MDYTGFYHEVLNGNLLMVERHPDQGRFWVVTVDNGESGLWTSGDIQRLIDSYLIVKEGN